MSPTLATLLTISVTVIAVILVFILICLIPVLLQVRRTANEAEKLIDSVRLQVAPFIRDITAIVLDIKSVIQSIHQQLDKADAGIKTVHDIAVRVIEFQSEIQRRIEEPLLQLSAIFSGLKRGFEAVTRIFLR